MKIEIEVIKKYLEALRDSDKAFLELDELADNLGININGNAGADEAFHYLKILHDQDLIEGVNMQPGNLKNVGFMFTSEGLTADGSAKFRLTHQGHKVLETLSQSKFWEASKKQFQTLGAEGLKIIPNLAVEYIKSTLNIDF